MFETITPAPPDAILGLTEAFRNDPNPRKINLGVGVYKDESGRTPVLEAVKRAEEILLGREASKSYLDIDGTPAYATAVQELLFGAAHEAVASKRAVTAQAPGGTGALRIAADFIARLLPGKRVWLSEPTWPNHPNVFRAAGLEVATYPYFDAARNGVNFERMMATVEQIPAGDVLLLHCCCHNPTGSDLAAEQWQQIAEVVAAHRLLPLIDFAYQGFADGLREDAGGLAIMAQSGRELLVASSFSKNFGLYNERVGALTLLADDEQSAQAALSHLKQAIRANYSNPPAHGAAIVTTVLGDPHLRRQWESEVTVMRDRINTMRHLFVETLNEKGVARDFSFIAHQRGMFSFSGLNADQVKALRERYAIYVVGGGRINVAGMTTANMDYLCGAIADVLRD
jgi:aspartate/tyrosine/aromatic aminotransferase